ncbi:response regulator [Flavobacterium album]|uniref:Response regulator n=1 Tax=Flavobacterium album TaxID=2175091 RepID=A0A2S1QZD9_9FLAO|nr:response regulator [Flavobacterium album]AWH85776.1 response regulator [Flavobacterium album]
MYSKNVFLSDDDLDDVEFFQIALSEICGQCTLTVSYDGAELLDQLVVCTDDSNPDIIFLDVNMPKVNGLEALEAIRETPRFREVPVVVYSTSSSDHFISDAHRLGANYYFVKPSTINALREQISMFLSFDWKKYVFPTDRSKFLLGSNDGFTSNQSSILR